MSSSWQQISEPATRIPNPSWSSNFLSSFFALLSLPSEESYAHENNGIKVFPGAGVITSLHAYHTLSPEFNALYYISQVVQDCPSTKFKVIFSYITGSGLA